MRSVVGEWDPEVIDQAIPELPKAASNGHRTAGGVPPVELGPAAMQVWRGEKPKPKEGGGIDRSGSLVKVGRELFDKGATRPAIVAALAERDEALGWRKYTGRRDAEDRYHEIVDELERTGRNARTRLATSKDSRTPAPSFNLTDLGNAERFIADHGRDVRY